MRAQVYFHHCHTLSDARYAAAEGFEFIAFSIDPTQADFPGMAKLKEIAGWVSGPRLVGQFPANTPLAVIRDATAFLGLEAIELPHPVSAETAKLLEMPILVRIPWEENTNTMAQYLEQGHLLILESHLSFDQLIKHSQTAEIKTLCEQYDMILACNFNADTLTEALESWTPYGIALRGGDEERPGWYNYEQLESLTEVLNQ